MEEATIQTLAIQLARLETKVDNVLVIAAIVQDHEKRLIRAEEAIEQGEEADKRVDRLDDRVTVLEQTQWKIMGVAGVIGAIFGAIGTWLMGIVTGVHH
jgi:hypothetical protein